MPPKKGGKDKKGGKGKGKKDADPGDAELGPAELLVQAKLRIESLERQLVWREEKLQGALSAQRELKQQVDNYHADFEREKTEIFDISADMTRQYKGMQAGPREPRQNGPQPWARAPQSRPHANRRATFCARRRPPCPQRCQNPRSFDPSIPLSSRSQEELLARLNTLENQIASQKDQLEMSGIQLEEVRAEKAQELAKKDAEIAEQQLKMEDMAVEFGEMLKETLEKMSERIEITNSSWDSGTGEQAARRLEEFKLSNMGAE
mmetsp:Transcript_85293/g.255581  ORF Transcript_85293/g.255581 Transcript_85293/m.255581 type:complete len:263 (+) Transcript_85293:130-918(+)